MKKSLAIILTLILALGVFVGIGISAYAEESTQLIEIPSEFYYPDDTQMNLSSYNLPIEEIKALFPETVETKYENGVYYAKDIGAAKVQVYSYSNFQRYDMTLVDGYWTAELTSDEAADQVVVEYRGAVDNNETYDDIYTIRHWECSYNDGVRGGSIDFGDSGNFNTVRLFYNSDEVTIHYYIYEKGVGVENTYENGVLTQHEVGFDVEGASYSYAYYDASKNLTYIGIYVSGNYYYLFEQGWSSSWYSYQACDAPAGFENYTLENFAALAPHDIGCQHEWIDASCLAPRTCSLCDKTQGEAKHNYEAVVTEPTCEEAGYTTYTCSGCGDTYTADEVAAPGHSWVDADCDTPKTCSVCSATEGEALGHSFTEGKCTVCDEADPDYVPEAPKDEEPTDSTDPTNGDLKELSFFEKLIQMILDFFKKLFGIK